MKLKKSLFTIAFINITIAFILSIFIIWVCIELRSRIDPIGGNSIDINSTNSIRIIQSQGLTAQTIIIAEIISLAQILLPILIYIIALFATASMFYRLKLKEPLSLLLKGATCIIENDLNFTIETKSQDELGQL